MRVHLVCNAHLDPAWLWELEEGAAEVLSTFRIAADFCERYEGFVFNHNESILYQWVLDFDPELFARIQALVRAGRWHIMGGWFLQPDCNMPAGESFVRQILAGRTFFREHFGVEPTTAINFDPFGHSRGLVQILAKAGYDSYIHMRPHPEFLELPANYYRWVGYDGSSVVVARRTDGYNSQLGAVGKKIDAAVEREAGRESVLLLWGIGNHGGGPSRIDVERIGEMQHADYPAELVHSTPEAFFAELAASGEELPEWRGDLNPWAPGCYTSQIRIKQKHRRLEAMLYALERTAVHADLAGLVRYPAEELAAMQSDLLTAEFHDILPGSSIKPVEDASIRLLDHGLEIAARVRMMLFFAMARALPPLAEGVMPVVAWNPAPADAEGVWECEFQPAAQNWEPTFTDYEVYQDGVRVPSQIEHEASSLSLDWRKKVVFRATLPASAMTRFECRPVMRESKPTVPAGGSDETLVVGSEQLRLELSATTGFVRSLSAGGRELVRPGAFRLLVVDDYEDPWGSTVRSYRDVVGEFEPMAPERLAEYTGSARDTVPPVRVVEDGEVRSVVEAAYEYHDSTCVVRYLVPKHGTVIDLELEVNWQEKNRMLKLSLPTVLPDAVLRGQVAYGTEELPTNGDEVVTQRWQAVVSDNADLALGVVDDGVYGSDFADGELRVSLVHGPVYSALKLGERPLVSDDRIHPRIDQGERRFRFRILGGSARDVLASIHGVAASFNEPPYLLSLFTDGVGAPVEGGLRIEHPQVLCSALKAAESGEGYVLRLFNATGEPVRGKAALAAANLDLTYDLGPFEVATYRFDTSGAWSPVDLLERE